MVRRGYPVLLIADTLLTEPWPEVPVIDLPAALDLPVIRYIFWELRVRNIIRIWKPDVLHAHRVSSAGWLGAFSGFHPFVVTPWGSDLYLHPDRSATARWLARYVMKKADLVTADSLDLCRKAIDFGAREAATHVIQWGVDLALFQPGNDLAYLRRSLMIEVGPVILSPRGLNPVYNIDTIIRSIPRVKKEFPEVVYLLRKYNEEPGYQSQVEQLIQELDLSQTVRWVGRIEPWQAVADYYKLADIVISVPSSDSTAVSVLEAMACGAPVIASDLPSTREWITDGENGLLVAVKDVEQLAQATIRLLQNPKQRGIFSDLNRKLVEDKANHELEMEKMEQLYLGLLPAENHH
jgi:glycosyltransferase involved in cell wall biosynthesis